MNSGVFGPVLHDNFQGHWSRLFIDKITDKVKLVDTTIVALPRQHAGKYVPKIEVFFFMTDKIGLNILIRKKKIFMNHKNKYSAIVNGEYGLSKCILDHGYTIDCMLPRYQGINWRNSENYKMNNNKHPSRKNSFYKTSINPYEVIFHKWFWHGKERVNFRVIDFLNDKN